MKAATLPDTFTAQGIKAPSALPQPALEKAAPIELF